MAQHCRLNVLASIVCRVIDVFVLFKVCLNYYCADELDVVDLYR